MHRRPGLTRSGGHVKNDFARRRGKDTGDFHRRRTLMVKQAVASLCGCGACSRIGRGEHVANHAEK